LRKFFEGIRHYTIWNPDELRQGTKRLQPKLERSGRNLPSVIGYLAKHAPKNVEKLIKDLQKEFPWLRDIVSKGGPYGSRTLLVKAKHGRRSQEYRATQVSDGFLRILALATMTYQGDKPTVLAFEEPENGVHPQLLRFQVDSLLALSSGTADYSPQVFLATHSPHLLDYVPFESVLVMAVDRKGDVKVQSINRSAPLLHDAGLLPGEAWAYRGEKALIAKSRGVARRKHSDSEQPQFLDNDASVQQGPVS
jgi:predicted ATPase